MYLVPVIYGDIISTYILQTKQKVTKDTFETEGERRG